MASDKSCMDLYAIALQGMQRAEAGVNRAATRIARLEMRPAPQALADRVELSAEILNLIESKNAFAAATKIARTADEMQKLALGLMSRTSD